MAEHLRFEREAQDDAAQACCEPERDLQRPARFVDCAERPHERPPARFGAAGRLEIFMFGQASPAKGWDCPQTLTACIAPAPEVRSLHVNIIPNGSARKASAGGAAAST